MRTFLLIACLVSLLIPSISAARQPDLPSWLNMLTEENIDMQELQSFISGMLSEEALMQIPADEITTEANYLSYVCYYIAFTAILDFIDCLVYYDIGYDCRSAIINGLLFYYFC